MVESLAARRRGLGRHRRRAHGGACLVRPRLRLSDAGRQVAAQAAPWNNRVDFSGDLPFDNPYRGVPAADPIRCDPSRATRRSRPRSSFWRHRPGHQFHRASSRGMSTVERQIGAGVGGLGQLSGQLLGPSVGARAAQSGCLPRTWSLHAQRRELSGLLNSGESRGAAHIDAGESGAGQGLLVHQSIR